MPDRFEQQLHHDHDSHHGAVAPNRAQFPRRHGPHPMGSRDDSVRLGGPRGRSRRSKRGDVRAAVLLLLEEQPRNGYQLIQELEQRSSGVWRPSPGSIYPVLSQLEDEGLVAIEAHESGRTFSMTEAGRRYLEERRTNFGQPWEAAAATAAGPRFDLYRNFRLVVTAVRQVLEAGTDEQAQRSLEVLKDARRKIYLILAEEE